MTKPNLFSTLHGLLKKVRDLGLPLVSVCPLEHGQADTPDVKSGMDSSTLERRFAFENISSRFNPR